MDCAVLESVYLDANKDESLRFSSEAFMSMINHANAKLSEIATFLGVDTDTIEMWVKTGRVPKTSAEKFDKLWCKLVNLLNADLTWEYFDCVMPDQNDPKGLLNIQKPENDNVNRPSHYTCGDIEVIDYIRDKLSSEQFTGFCLGNVLKYVSRHRFKNGLEDLKKAEVYLKWAIENEERSSSNA